MKFAFATALLAFASGVQAVEVATEVEYHHNSYDNHGAQATAAIVGSYSIKYNGHGHHSYSDHSSSSDSSYSSSDYSSSDNYGYGYRYKHGRARFYRYAPRYYSGRYYYGKAYVLRPGHYKPAYRAYPLRSYSACYGCVRPSYYSSWH